MKTTAQALKAVSKINDEMRQAATNLINGRIELNKVKPIVEAYCQKILDSEKFANVEGGIITDKNNSYLMNDTDFDKYMNLVEIEKKAAGFDLAYGYCPLLIQEHKEHQLCIALVDSLYPVTGLKWEYITEYKYYKQATDLCLGLIETYSRETGMKL